MKNETLHIFAVILALVISAMIFLLFVLVDNVNKLNTEIETIKRDIKTIQFYHEAEEWNDTLIRKAILPRNQLKHSKLPRK